MLLITFHQNQTSNKSRSCQRSKPWQQRINWGLIRHFIIKIHQSTHQSDHAATSRLVSNKITEIDRENQKQTSNNCRSNYHMQLSVFTMINRLRRPKRSNARRPWNKHYSLWNVRNTTDNLAKRISSPAWERGNLPKRMSKKRKTFHRTTSTSINYHDASAWFWWASMSSNVAQKPLGDD